VVPPVPLGNRPDSWLTAQMTLEDLADLIRANSANLNRRMEELHAEGYGVVLNLPNDLTDVRKDGHEVKATLAELRGDLAVTRTDVADLKAGMSEVRAEVAEVRRSLDLAETVAAMKRQIERLEAEVAGLKRRA